jgi:molybdopterin-guanine dinucleotide biosynthesis protein A
VSGIVLAGGRSTRFGTDKLAATYRGQPLLEHAVAALTSFCDEVITVVSEVRLSALPAGMRIARDEVEDEGPLAGTLAGLEAVAGTRAVVVGGDMPDMVPAVLGLLVEQLDRIGGSAVALHDGERMRPLPCAVSVEAASARGRELFDAGERSLRAMLEALGAVSIAEGVWTALDPERRTLFDVDEPGDLPPA